MFPGSCIQLEQHNETLNLGVYPILMELIMISNISAVAKLRMTFRECSNSIMFPHCEEKTFHDRTVYFHCTGTQFMGAEIGLKQHGKAQLGMLHAHNDYCFKSIHFIS